MGTRVFDQSIFIGDSDTDPISTSSNYHFLTIDGDTLQIAQARSISSNSADGNPGEIAWNSVTVLGITTHYLYLCYATNSWKRVAFSNVAF